MSESSTATPSFFRSLESQHPLAADTMLKYFLSTLDVRLKLIEPKIGGDAGRQVLFKEIRAEIDSFFEAHREGSPKVVADDAWGAAYRLERVLALIEPAENLISEVRRRLDEASEEKVLSSARLRVEFEVVAPLTIDTAQSPPTLKPRGEELLRGLLLDILEETHWHFQRKFHSRPIQKSATRRLVLIGLAACFLFVFPYIYLYASEGWWGSESRLPLARWAWLPLWTALTAGFFGAMFSRLLYLQTSWNALSIGALKDARDWSSVLLRGAVGMSGAIVVYFFLQSGILGGELFPNFENIGLKQLYYPERAESNPTESLRLVLPNPALALLVVWSFLAGFSERLVPSILQTTENSLAEASQRPRSITR